jgi:hypothetical protein
MTDQRQERRTGSWRVGIVRKDWEASLYQIEGAWLMGLWDYWRLMIGMVWALENG